MFEGLTRYIPDLEKEETAGRCLSKIEAASDRVMQAIANLYPPWKDGVSKNEPRK